MTNRNRIGSIKRANADFYSDKNALRSSTYSQSLNSLNVAVGIGYILFATFIAICLKEILLIYKFTLESGVGGQTNEEVLTWAENQARAMRFDLLSSVLIICSLLFIAVIVVFFYRIKSYNLYKYQKKLLVIPFLFGVFQLAIAIGYMIVTFKDVEAGRIFWIGFFYTIQVLFSIAPNLSAGKLLYRLEFKHLSGLFKALNSIAECFLKRLS